MKRKRKIMIPLSYFSLPQEMDEPYPEPRFDFQCMHCKDIFLDTPARFPSKCLNQNGFIHSFCNRCWFNSFAKEDRSGTGTHKPCPGCTRQIYTRRTPYKYVSRKTHPPPGPPQEVIDLTEDDD